MMENLDNSVILLENITKYYDKKKVIDNLNLNIGPGEVTCLLGPSGCGKSTTLRIAAGVEKQDTGNIYLHQNLISSPNKIDIPSEERNIGLIFQDFALFPHLNVFDNIVFGIKKKLGRNEAKSRVLDLIERFRLQNHENKFPHMLSGGEKQRVALARAMATKPKVMLMDEPFSGLDNRLRDGVRDEALFLLKEENTSVLLVTHDPDEAMKIADKIILMRNGKVIQEGGPYNMYNNPIDQKTASFFSDVNILTGKVKNSQIYTPFGYFITPGFFDGDEVNILIRPQHLKIDFDRKGKGPEPTAKDGVPAKGFVSRSRFLGKESLVELIMDHDKSILKATIPGVFLPQKGTILWLSMRRDRCLVFSSLNK